MDKQQHLENLLFDNCVYPYTFALLEPHIHPDVQKALLEYPHDAEPLLPENYPFDLRDATAQLLSLAPNTPISQWFIHQAYAKGWAVFIKTDLSKVQLQVHLSHFAHVADSDGRTYLFSLCNPLFTQAWLNGACQENRGTHILQGHLVFLLEDEDPQNLISFAYDTEQQGVYRKTIDLEQSDSEYHWISPNPTPLQALPAGPWTMSHTEQVALLDARYRLLATQISQHLLRFLPTAQVQKAKPLKQKTAAKIKQLREKGLTDKNLMQAFCELEYLYPTKWQKYLPQIDEMLNKEDHNIEYRVEYCLERLETLPNEG